MYNGGGALDLVLSDFVLAAAFAFLVVMVSDVAEDKPNERLMDDVNAAGGEGARFIDDTTRIGLLLLLVLLFGGGVVLLKPGGSAGE